MPIKNRREGELEALDRLTSDTMQTCPKCQELCPHFEEFCHDCGYKLKVRRDP